MAFYGFAKESVSGGGVPFYWLGPALNHAPKEIFSSPGSIHGQVGKMIAFLWADDQDIFYTHAARC